MNLMFKQYIENLSQEDIFYARRNRDWEYYDTLNEKEKKETFINECLSAFGRIDFKPSFEKISEQGILLFGKYKDKHISKVPKDYKLWAIKSVPFFEDELKYIFNND